MKTARNWTKKNLGNGVTTRQYRGGLVISYRPTDAPALALAAHLDHPGFSLSQVSPKGAQAELLGGLPKEQLVGTRVQAFPAGAADNRPAAFGLLGEPEGDIYPVQWENPPEGRPPVFAVLDLPAFGLKGPWLYSRSIDDLLGAAISLEVLKRAARERIKGNLTVLLNRAEEVGFIGALELIREGAVRPEDSILSIETSKRLPRAVPGRGPIIRTGDKACLFDPNLGALLVDSAQRLKVQRRRMSGGTCEATAYQAFGYEAAGAAIPLVNYHNRGRRRVAPEMVRLDDLQPCVELLLEAARRFPEKALRGRLKARLSDRLRKMSPRLGWLET